MSEITPITLLGEIADLTAQLAGQQLSLLGWEVRQEGQKVEEAALCVAGAAGLFAAGGMLSSFSLGHLLHRSTRLPLWACYGLAAGAAGAAGMGLLKTGRAKVADVRPALPETVAGLKENLTWLKEQLSP